MVKVIGVRFRTAGKIYYFDPLNFQVKRGDHVIVETARGVEYGTVVGSPREVEDDKVVQPLKPVLRVATERDDEQEAGNKAKEKEAFKICQEKIRKHGLEMKLVNVSASFDGSKIIFFFTADGRVELGSYELPIIEITYRYILFVSEQLGYTGGCFDLEDYPIYETSQDCLNICGIEAQISVEDSELKIEAGRNKCAVYVTGGDIEITYANEIVFDQYGQMTESNETTVHVQHNFKAVHELPEGYIEK